MNQNENCANCGHGEWIHFGGNECHAIRRKRPNQHRRVNEVRCGCPAYTTTTTKEPK